TPQLTRVIFQQLILFSISPNHLIPSPSPTKCSSTSNISSSSFSPCCLPAPSPPPTRTPTPKPKPTPSPKPKLKPNPKTALPPLPTPSTVPTPQRHLPTSATGPLVTDARSSRETQRRRVDGVRSISVRSGNVSDARSRSIAGIIRGALLVGLGIGIRRR
ncbi:hypothetical protein K440DRAFT_661937, partial [Wilcoxina mikolae CBS 423.85]